MSLTVTVLGDGERFCTMHNGQLVFWEIKQGSPRTVPDHKATEEREWVLEMPEGEI